MPYPNEHAARLKSPGAFERFRRQNKSGGVSFIYGINSAGAAVLQAIRFAKANFTVEQARAWLKSHGHKPILFEPASGAIGEGVFILEGETLQATLLREGVSKNGHLWRRKVLEQLAKIVNGVPVHFYDLSRTGDGSFAAHWESLRQRLPPFIRAILPERIPEAEVGRVANARVEEDSKGAKLVGEVQLSDTAGWFRGLLERAKSAGRRLGLSIHVPGDGMTARDRNGGRGLEPLNVERVVGFDVVSFPSAGGTLEAILEALTTGEREMKDLIERLLRHVRAKRKRTALAKGIDNPGAIESTSALVEDHEEFVTGLFEALDLEVEDEQRVAVLEALYATAPDPEPAPRKKSKKKTSNRRRARPVVEDEDEDDDEPDDDAPDAVSRDDFDGLTESVKKLLRAQSEGLIESKVNESNLPKPLKELAKKQLTRMLDAKGLLEAETIDGHLKELAETVAGNGNGNGNGLIEGSEVQRIVVSDYTSGDRALVAFNAMLDGEEFGHIGEGQNRENIRAMRGIREAWGVLTGDLGCEGAYFFERNPSRRPRGVIEARHLQGNPYLDRLRSVRPGMIEAVETTSTHASFNLILADAMHKRMVRDYKNLAHIWSLITAVESASDFRSKKIIRGGEMNNLSSVAESGLYSANDLNALTNDEQVTIAVTKYGGVVLITWEAIKNDDLRFFRKIPSQLARAAERTLNEFVWKKIIGTTAGDTDYDVDSLALAHASHGNLQSSTAYSATALKTARKKMTQQKDISSKEAGRVAAKHVFAGPEQIDAVYEDLFSDGKPNLTVTNVGGTPATDNYPPSQDVENAMKANVLRSRYGLQLHELHYFDDTSDADRVVVTADKSDIEMVALAFLDGQRNPQIFVQDLDRVGSFFDEEVITYKIRHIYDATVVDYRGFQFIVP